MSDVIIKGESGKALDDALRPISDLAEAASLSFGSLRVDDFSFSLAPESEIGGGEPDEGQSISLFIGGERVFHGIVSTVSSQWRESSLSTQVKVMGAWWWLEQTPMSELVGEVERPQFKCAKGSVASHIQSLFDRLKALNVPVDLGEIDECYDIPTVTFRDGPFSSALAELIRYVPDAVGWWDYSGEGNPMFNLSRRSMSNSTNFTLGVDPVISSDLQAEYGLEIKSVDIPYAERIETGETVFRTQTSSGGESGSRQVSVVSGPELADFVPPDPIDGVTITTVDSMANSTTVSVTAVEKVWEFWVGWKDRNPDEAASRGLLLWDESAGLSSTFYPDGLEPFIELEDGTALDISTHNRWAITYDSGTEIPSWMEEVETIQKAKIKGTVWLLEPDPVGTPDWLKELVQAGSEYYVHTGGTGNPPGQNNDDRSIFFNLDIDIILLDRSLTDKTLYKPLSYVYESPPNGFAENLRKAQAWLPYSGDVVLQAPEGPLRRYTGETINLINGRPKWEEMGALAQGESVDLFTGHHSIDLGLPARLSGVTPVTRLERDPKDNVINI